MISFATNGINLTKLESYIVGGFAQATFFADVSAHIDDPRMVLAMDELRFFCESVHSMGTYPRQDPERDAK